MQITNFVALLSLTAGLVQAAPLEARNAVALPNADIENSQPIMRRELEVVEKREAKFLIGAKPLAGSEVPKFATFVKNKFLNLIGKGSE